MATNRILMPNEGWSQARQRSLAIFYDQHKDGDRFPNGRPWWCYVERPADGAAMPMPVGELQPHGWDAPWYPESKYVAMAVGRLSDNHFRLDYQRMITDYTAELRAYYAKAVREAAAQNFKAPVYGGAVEYRLRMIVGEAPKSPKVPEAALAGDRWLLGFTKEPNESLQRLLTMNSETLESPEESVSNADQIEDLRRKLDALIEAQGGTLPPKRRGRKPKAIPAETTV